MENRIFVDTNALIRLLENDTTVIELLDGKIVFISEMTEMEMLCNANMTKEARKIVQAMLNECSVVSFSQDIKQRAIKIRLSTRMKLVDAIIAATAIGLNLPIVTRDKGFESLGNDLNLILLS